MTTRQKVDAAMARLQKNIDEANVVFRRVSARADADVSRAERIDKIARRCGCMAAHRCNEVVNRHRRRMKKTSQLLDQATANHQSACERFIELCRLSTDHWRGMRLGQISPEFTPEWLSDFDGQWEVSQ